MYIIYFGDLLHSTSEFSVSSAQTLAKDDGRKTFFLTNEKTGFSIWFQVQMLKLQMEGKLWKKWNYLPWFTIRRRVFVFIFQRKRTLSCQFGWRWGAILLFHWRFLSTTAARPPLCTSVSNESRKQNQVSSEWPSD